MQQLAQSSPEVSQIVNMINQNGGNGEQLFYALARQKGMDPQSIIQDTKNMLNQTGIKY